MPIRVCSQCEKGYLSIASLVDFSTFASPYNGLASNLASRFLVKMQRTLTVGGSITVLQVSSLTRLDFTKKENLLFFVCSETETSSTVILPPTVSFLWSHLM